MGVRNVDFSYKMSKQEVKTKARDRRKEEFDKVLQEVYTFYQDENGISPDMMKRHSMGNKKKH